MTTITVSTKLGEVENKMQIVWGSVTTTVLDTKNGVVLNKRPNASSLVTTTVLNTKLGEAENKILGHDKCISTLKFNKFDAKLKQGNLATNHDLNAISQLLTKIKKNRKTTNILF